MGLPGPISTLTVPEPWQIEVIGLYIYIYLGAKTFFECLSCKNLDKR